MPHRPEILLPGMKFAMDFAESLVVHVGVDLGGDDVGVAEEFLDDPQVRPAREHVCGEAVAKRVG